ncbi:MAG: hypothetical protein VKN72_05925 [Nostocales cyanobacterium 94392]|nr:hypothetical protein [Nostocales cyanobacterium 94392]
MSEDLTQQWLTEIQSLKQQIAQLQAERIATWESTEKWRKLYNTEAEQRRNDAQLFQQTIASLKAEIQKLKGIEDATLPDSETVTAIQQEVAQLTTVEDLKTKLTLTMKERDRLLQALKTEQENHSQTRKSLTTALGDAIDGLKRQKN